MRLNKQEQIKIKNACELVSKKLNLTWKRISLFGSRIDPTKRGGDIDLYFFFESMKQDQVREVRRDLLIALWDTLGEQKIDLIIDWPENKENRDFISHLQKNLVDIWVQ